MTARYSDKQLELDLNAGPGEEDGSWAKGWVRRAPPGVLADNLELLIDHVATLNVVGLGERDVDVANESWRSLPEHLRKAIERREAAVQQDD